ncbi:phosphodiester glycosidase family protein [Pseudooceanicola onchidii]|uniref:phosphodiester glycosidase family protein n=1 Tax=Pseudooceanicola onchidii TaxID=2562279 RepID=UPI0010AAD7C1|nr:phosphodiester glycosidase family protein [Pseudooceanicola onchidii]
MRVLAALVLALWASPAFAVDCRDETVGEIPYTICEVAADEDIRLFLTDPGGAPYGTFEAVDARLGDSGRLVFAMNAGMYHEDRSPVGHYREGGEEVRGLITSAGPGNFGMLPNGVFCIGADRLRVIESLAYEALDAADCPSATQSGPMLVIDGKLHPRFLPDSTSRYIRNGVGVSEDGSRAFFVMSQLPVTFHQFASLFRDRLKTPQALYFDGNVSRLYAPQLDRNDLGFRMGPIVGVVEAAD